MTLAIVDPALPLPTSESVQNRLVERSSGIPDTDRSDNPGNDEAVKVSVSPSDTQTASTSNPVIASDGFSISNIHLGRIMPDDAVFVKPKSRFVWVQDFCNLPPSETWLIQNYLEPDSLSVLFGDSESYKSFLMIDIACHIATGKAWRGNKVKQGVCLFIAGEGGNGLKKRIRAWFEYHRLPMANIAISVVPLALCDPSNTGELIKDIKMLLRQSGIMPSFIGLDTLNTHFGPGDENGTSDMTKFLSVMRELRIATGGHVMASHHCGHGDKSRSRGSIVLHNGIDWEYRAERKPDTQITTIFNTKSKDADKPQPLAWTLERQDLPWATEEGVPMASCVLLPAELPDEEPKAGSHNVALTALRNALVDHGQESAGLVTVSDDQWRQAAYDAGISNATTQDGKRKAFVRAKSELVLSGKVREHEGRYWITVTRNSRTDRTDPDIRLCPG